MVDILDIVIVGGGAYYLSKKVNSDDESFKRMILGAAVGVPVAMRGPEAYKAVKEYYENDVNADKLTGSLIMGAVGYMLGDKILGSDQSATGNTKKGI